MEGKSQQASAAASGMSVRTARTWQRGRLPSEKKGKRRWRTRPDPFAGVWAEEVEPLLRGDVEGALKATTILEWLEERHPGRFSMSQLRTLQRRLRDWRAVSGPDREVYFEQAHPPGREAQMDFTHCGELGVTVGGEPFGHLLFHFVLSHSGWRYVDLAYGETFAALVKGMQGALWELGGVPEVLRTDNLSAATHELKGSGGRALNERYAAVLAHYGLRSTRTNPRSSHENGVAEQGHHRLKDAIGQALVLRGSRDFGSVDVYLSFVRQVADKRNRLVMAKLEHERRCLRPLPPAPVPEYVTYRTKVRKWSTVRVANRTYTVPSPADRYGGGGPAVRRSPGGLLQGPPGRAYGSSAWRWPGRDRLPPRHRLAGAQARCVRAVQVQGAYVPHRDLPPGLRCTSGVEGRACRRGVRTHPSPGRHHDGVGCGPGR